MALTSRYFILTPTGGNLDFIDYRLNYGSVTTVGENVQVNGSSQVDSVFVRPGLTYDLTNTAGGVDKIYLTGNLSDYGLAFDNVNQILTLTRNAGTSKQEIVTVAGGSTFNYDNLIFANGTVPTNTLALAVQNSTALPVPSSSETSVAPMGAAAPGAMLNATIQAYSTNPAAINQVGETFASVKPGINYVINGGNGIDTVYVADGERVDASVTGSSVDLIYFRGRWADYTKTTAVNDTELVFTRTINGYPESVTVAGGTVFNHDKLIFADGAVTSDNALTAIKANRNVPLVSVPGVDPSTVTPLYSDEEVAAALAAIAYAAEHDTAISSSLGLPSFTVAGVTGVIPANLTSIDTALDSMAIHGAQADTTTKVQDIVNAYLAILASANGTLGDTSPALTGQQYSNIGVTGLNGLAAPGNALYLLDNVVDGSPQAAVDTEPEVQALANAAMHVIDTAGGTAAQAAALTLADLTALGISRVTPDNLPAVLAAIRATTPDTAIDTKRELQDVVSAAVDNATNAINTIRDAAQGNTAISSGLDLPVYAAAGVSGVDATNLVSIDLALDSQAVRGMEADSTFKVQGIVNAYNAILASANGVTGDTTTPLTGAQYTAIGVTGVSGFAAPGNPMNLLDSAVDGSPRIGVDTVVEVQAMADAAGRVIAAAGGTPTQIAALTLADLTALGITDVTPGNLPAVRVAIGAVTSDTSVDTVRELQDIVNMGVSNAATALGLIAAAAEGDTAIRTGLDIPTFVAAGVSGVTVDNRGSIDSALDSLPVRGINADTTREVQDIVDAYSAILASANGTLGDTIPALTGMQYSTVGVTAISGFAVPGNAMYLLDNVVDTSQVQAVDTVPELQAIANAALHVISGAAGGMGPTVDDFAALGVTGVGPGNIAAVVAAIAATPDDGTAVDTKGELQDLVTALSNSASNALIQIRDAAQNDTAVRSVLPASVFATAGVSGVTPTNQNSIDTALDSAAIGGGQADTVSKVQDIVNAYLAILASANGTLGDTSPALTGQQYANIGVTNVPGLAAAGNALFLLDNVVDGSPQDAVDTEPEVQAMANAAIHVIDAAGGSAAQAAALTLADLTALGITGATPDNLPAVLAAIRATTPDTAIDTKRELQDVVSNAATAAFNALNIIANAAEHDTAISSGLGLLTFMAAGVSGVNVGNLTSIDSALDSLAVKGINADTTTEVQNIVNAYNAILASADGVQENTTPALTSTPYTLVGVTGVSGVSAPGNVMHLLDSAVDANLAAAVDTVPELQAMAVAAAHVLTGAAGGTAPTLADLNALGITGVNPDNLAPVLAAIAATSDDGTGVDTFGELQSLVTATVNARPTLSGGALATVTNLDVTSNLVLNSTQSLTVGTGMIHIIDNGGAGYQNDPGVTGDGHTNNQNIEIGAAIASHMVQIVGTGANTHIVINPLWDLDLSSSYTLTIDDGVFRNADGSQAAAHIDPINFSTVIPGTHVAGTVATEAHASQKMVDSTGGLVAGMSWMDIQGIGNNTGPVAQLGDLSGGSYALVMKNYATAPGGTINTGDGIATHDTNVGVTNFGVNDLVYFDGQANNGSQFYDPRYTSMANGGTLGGLPGQNALIMGLVASPQQAGSTANILLGLEGNTTPNGGTIYASVVSLPDGTVGWSNVWHGGTSGVVMG